MSLEDSLKLSYKMFRMHYITGQIEYKAQKPGRQSQLDFFFQKNCSRHIILADIWLTRRFLYLPRRRSTENYLGDKMLINEWETVFNDLSIYRN